MKPLLAETLLVDLPACIGHKPDQSRLLLDYSFVFLNKYRLLI